MFTSSWQHDQQQTLSYTNLNDTEDVAIVKSRDFEKMLSVCAKKSSCY